MLRRFDQFQFGPLSANRLNQLVDAVIALQRKVEDQPKFDQPKRETIIAMVTGDGARLGSETCGDRSMPAVVYDFQEIGIRTEPQGPIGPSTCMVRSIPANGISNATNAMLVVFEDAPSLAIGDVVVCHRISESYISDGSSPKLVYVTSGRPAAAVQTYVIIGTKAGDAYSYIGVREDFPGTGNETIINLYEQSMWYGAKDDPQNECATLVERRLRPGDLVFGYKIGDFVYTCAPTAWTVECQPCGSAGVMPMNVMDTAPAKEMVAADIVLRGR